MSKEHHVVAVSGGKDSTAMALELQARNPDVGYRFVCTPTGNELPEVAEFREQLSEILGAPIEEIRHPRGGLIELSRLQGTLPSTRMRWCTRMLKIQPYEAFCARLKQDGGMLISYVGLRADEPEREGMYGQYVDGYRYPLREWGWGLGEVMARVRQEGLELPWRTDCALCPYQRIGEWKRLMMDYPAQWAEGEELEAGVSESRERLLSIRSPSRDTWPAQLKDLAEEFRSGRKVRKGSYPTDGRPCRVCTM